MDLLSLIKKTFTGIQSWHTNRRIIVIESDDWGSIRMPDKATYDKLLAKGIRVDRCPFNRFDCLASEKDLTLLFEILASFSDINGNPPVLTANCVLVNPDFDKIRESGFNEYHYELFTETLKKYPGHLSSFQLWKEGIENKVFLPQFHGREHLNVDRWMKALKDNLPETLFAFDLNMFGLSTFISNENRRSYLAAFDVHGPEKILQLKEIIMDGLSLFRNIFGYQAKACIAPNYIWPISIEKDLSDFGIQYIQSRMVQLAPESDSTKIKKIHHYTGQRNKFDQTYIITNCQFEPSFDYSKDSVGECLAQIDTAFKFRMPAIIAMHRVNFIGSIEQSNRERNLPLLKKLLTEINKKWPEVEYMTSNQLGDLINLEKRRMT